MSNNSVINHTGKLEDTKDKSAKISNNPMWTGIIGLMWLSTAVGSLQRLARSFADDVDKAVFIANWIPWLAVLCFALGWFMIHWIEVARSKNQHRIANLLLVAILVVTFSISAYLHFFSNNDVLSSFEGAVIPLVSSGGFLRYSVFRRDSSLHMQKR